MTSRRRTRRWIAAGVLAITAVAVVTAILTASTPGGRLDPAATSPSGARALVSLLTDRGVDVVVARNVDDVERAAAPQTMLLLAETYNLRGDELLRRLAAFPGDLLVVEPVPAIRTALTPAVNLSRMPETVAEPECDLREAVRAGAIQLPTPDTYDAADTATPLTRCYGGAVVRYRAAGRTVTVVGAGDFMTNGGLLKQGNAALAMNLAGGQSRLIWFAPQHLQGQGTGGVTIGELIPDAVGWVVLQLCLAVAVLAVARGRRLGPLVAERLPVVVRASETVEGRARLYRSRRARDRAAASLREAALRRLTPRLGLGAGPEPAAVCDALSRRTDADRNTLLYVLFGPPPDSDSALLRLAASLTDIERKVSTS